METFKLLGDLGLQFNKAEFMKHIFPTFIEYLKNNAAMVRTVGVEQSKLLATKFGETWIVSDYIPMVLK